MVLNMKIKRKEICFAIMLSIIVALFAVYFNMRNEEHYSEGFLWTELKSMSGISSFSQGTEQRSRLISETIEGELNRGTFEDAINKLEILTLEKDGYVKSLRMTYKDEVWSGVMICKVPPTSVTSFTFGAREIIDANGTVTYINISIESVNASQPNQEDAYSTINLSLKEVEPEKGKNGIIALIGSALPILVTSLVWIAEGLIIGVPLCFAFLGIIILVNRGIIPLWKNALKKPK